jgi:Arc/MetJ-type ribon-helix-helix transcriptional regulator
VVVKLSVSLSDADVAFVDGYARGRGTSRSAAVHEAISMLRLRELADEYQAAADEWERSGEQAAWDAVTADGLG